MASIVLAPSTYSLSSTYLTVNSASNMYTNTSSTTNGTVTNTRTSTSSYYIYLKGFNIDDVPEDAIVSSFSVKIKAYQTGGSTAASYRPYLCNGTTTLTGSTASAITTSTQTLTFTNANLTWDDIVSYGSDFSIRINCRRNSRNTQSVFYIYGAQIDVTYTMPVYHTITSETDGGTIIPQGQTQVVQGDSYSLTISGITPTVTDNGVDVTSQLAQSSQATTTLIPTSNTSSGFTVANITNAYADADSDDYASLELSGGSSSGTLYLELQDITLPANATLLSVSCDATLQYNRNNSSSGYTASCQMYAGNTAKGSSTSLVTAGGTDVAKTTFHLSVGSWSTSQLNNARLYITATNNASSTHRFLYVYGVSFNVTYESDGIIYTYTISNVTSDHTIIVTSSGPVETSKLYIKVSGTWKEVSEVYIKTNGTWVKQSDVTTVFQSGVNYKQE